MVLMEVVATTCSGSGRVVSGGWVSACAGSVRGAVGRV